MAEVGNNLVFVTGTDTGVGKTLVTAALARLLRRRGVDVGIMKPVETGVSDPTLPGPDATLLNWAANGTDSPDEYAPCRFREPLSPDQAAEAEKRKIDPNQLIDTARNLSARHRLTLVEGAGGLMVPLLGGYLTADLVRALGATLLVVSRPDLGTINHTLLTVFAARTMEIPVAGIVINQLPETPDTAQRNAAHAISSLASADLLAVLGQVKGTPQQQVEKLSEELAASPTLPWLLMNLGLKELL